MVPAFKEERQLAAEHKLELRRRLEQIEAAERMVGVWMQLEPWL